MGSNYITLYALAFPRRHSVEGMYGSAISPELIE